MRLFDLVRRPPRNSAESDPEAGEGHDKHSFGFGHRAHNPDPDASYGFEMDQTRVLPVREEARWR